MSELFINRQQFALSDKNFFAKETKKTGICIHYTAGPTAYSAHQSWLSRTDRVATSYIIDEIGHIHECFSPKFWGYHLGLKGKDWEGGSHDQRTIGIEIVNRGILCRKKDELFWWAANFGLRYCNIQETEKYKCASFRGYDYHATFEESQMVACIELVKHLCNTHSISSDIMKDPLEYNIEKCKSWQGISTHSAWRQDKWDAGPAFDFTRLKEALK